MHDKQQTGINRRNFLRAVSGASTVAVATAAATFTPSEAHAYNPGEEEMGTRYQETDHVKAFYRVNGYETLEK
ncbi:twin-arginine translocation signal domain-containing protein [Chelativorans salis]|uniref:Twin-arginine translocation signal domain-containing protein n=1 Tax=Chelativorans salis TaxID=2978478 RepID=A0ABT2LRL2_9HYPH|nr:twin-arginine translocation signal domain-containing protein [Chelativorans sp. EGI FJ00035]MCT7377183.1 twin-arginine translocation signal domain-containing protein [Chelativorans sp. EGI FJ00035]